MPFSLSIFTMDNIKMLCYFVMLICLSWETPSSLFVKGTASTLVSSGDKLSCALHQVLSQRVCWWRSCHPLWRVPESPPSRCSREERLVREWVWSGITHLQAGDGKEAGVIWHWCNRNDERAVWDMLIVKFDWHLIVTWNQINEKKKDWV